MDDPSQDPGLPVGPQAASGADPPEGTEQVHNLGKLLRVGGMLREMLDETRRESLDAEARRVAVDLLARAVAELKEAISPDLQTELERVHHEFSGEGAPGQVPHPMRRPGGPQPDQRAPGQYL
jgi:hypothetical protein